MFIDKLPNLSFHPVYFDLFLCRVPFQVWGPFSLPSLRPFFLLFRFEGEKFYKWIASVSVEDLRASLYDSLRMYEITLRLFQGVNFGSSSSKA